MASATPDWQADKNFAMREFPMTDGDFRFIQTLARSRTGIELSMQKREMIYSRLVRRIRALDLPDFASYCRHLETVGGEEMTHFINAITTNLTSFFREKHHFELLQQQILPEIRKRNQASRRLRIWSAGCSTGEEPYSISWVLAKSLGNENWNAKILATDLDSNVVSHGRKATYGADRVGDLPRDVVQEMFDRVGERGEDSYVVRDRFRQFVTFNRLNLLSDWPMKGQFDVIFCRNVVIYFSKDTQRLLFDRYADILAPGGYLFIGHSESLHGVTRRFEPLGKTVYRKIQ
jgi:chemotaxis protein methyltransferase CheR